MVVVANGLADFIAAEQRLFEVTDTVYSGLGDDVAPSALPTRADASAPDQRTRDRA